MQIGKTRMSIAIGREGILGWFTVQFTAATTLIAPSPRRIGEQRLDEKLLALAKPKLLIVEQLG